MSAFTVTVTEEIEPIYSLYMPANPVSGWRDIYYVGRWNAAHQLISASGHSMTILLPDCQPLGLWLDTYRPAVCDVPFI